MNFDTFLQTLPKIENIPVLGETSQFKMVPAFRHERLRNLQKEIKDAKLAGVLALFYPNKNNETHFVLILRNTYKGVHSAQVAFPGGRYEAEDESLEKTALRETFEEVGVPIADMEIIKKLSQVYIPPSNFYVQPYIGLTHKMPKFVRQTDEVEAVIEVSLSHFLDDSVMVTQKVKSSYSLEVEVPAFKLNGHIVWGATAMMLSEIKDLLKAAYNL
ncbi:CoA pyrophosphatase [Tamlana haliotis]|uniref:CoA pyrophosphatase n=1 Tax=Pseudotamlana haliotis TaxID=2614804 RepID=A0A6N6MA31_9FLAO|nr:CoA pyrophosphatase [Tamlana haliotis]KAB1067374.1 CoA pyrophosphatase [Tamlana haliotis]